MKGVIGGQFEVGGRIGSGSFGQLYKGKDLQSGDCVAIKCEPVDTRLPQVMYEAKLYRIFADEACGRIPSIYWRGVAQDHNVIVIDLLGPSLEDLFQSCGRKFSLKTVLMLADQMISCVEQVHRSQFLHRDLKPDNFLLGRGENASDVRIIDFGFAKKYREKNMSHIPYREGKQIIGTPRYMSLNTHRGIQNSRRDDLEALGYILLYFLKGRLPWQGLVATSQSSKQREIGSCKLSTRVEKLCEKTPAEFAMYCNYCRGLGFEDAPDYDYLKQLFRNLYVRHNYKDDGCFDWMVDVDLCLFSGDLGSEVGFNPSDTTDVTEKRVESRCTNAQGSWGSRGMDSWESDAALTKEL